MSTPKTYLDPTPESGAALFSGNLDAPVLMLNLLKFNQTANYQSSPKLMPEMPISGEAAFEKYIQHTQSFLSQSGGSIELLADGGHFFIGPDDERWDMVMIIKQSSLQSFLAFASNEDYLAGLGHRTAALEDSRLLPLRERI